jgi:drug/metabolite transporter (DMT)-like permease
VGLAWGLIGAFVSAVAYGIATVLQAIGAGRTADTTSGGGVDPRLLLRVLASLPFVIGLGFDVIGLMANLVALRELPLFAVQAIVNTSLAVTALVAVPLMKVRLGRRDWGAIGLVVLGLVLVGVSAGREAPTHTGRALHWGVLAAVIVLVGFSFLVIHVWGGNPALLGGCAGSLFGAFAICVRILPDLHPLVLLQDPALYALALASITGFLFFTTALQRGSVTLATAMLVVGETVIPAILGLVAFHDHTRHGFAAVAAVGFLCAVSGALALSRFGEVGPAHALSGMTGASDQADAVTEASAPPAGSASS